VIDQQGGIAMSELIVATQAGTPATEVKPKISTGDWLGLSGLLLALLAAALFAVGQANRAGFYYQLGFDLNQVPGDFYDTIYWGYATGSPAAILWSVAAVAEFLFFAATLWLGTWAWKRAARRWPHLRKLSTSGSSRRATAAGPHMLFVGLSMTTIGLAGFVFLTYWMIVGAQKAGKERGTRIVEALAADPTGAVAKYDTQWIEISIDSSPSRVEKGYRLLCTERLCSIYDPTPESRGIRLVSLEGMRDIKIGKR
jgi:hypothetical protein